MYYLIVAIGVFFTLGAVGEFLYMVIQKKFKFTAILRLLVTLLLGVTCLMITLPSLKYMVFKEYDVVKGECRVEISAAGRSASADFNLIETGDRFIFNEIPELDAYGKLIPYYCEVTVSKDHLIEIDYKIYDFETRDLMISSN